MLSSSFRCLVAVCIHACSNVKTKFLNKIETYCYSELPIANRTIPHNNPHANDNESSASSEHTPLNLLKTSNTSSNNALLNKSKSQVINTLLMPYYNGGSLLR